MMVLLIKVEKGSKPDINHLADLLGFPTLGTNTIEFTGFEF